MHQVKTDSGLVVDDWMWTDERSHVNVLVHLKQEDKYLMFFQTKYGLEKPAYATLGGLFNAGETALQCASRELEEEAGLVAGQMVPLGKVSWLGCAGLGQSGAWGCLCCICADWVIL